MLYVRGRLGIVRDLSGSHGAAAVRLRFGPHVPAVDPSQGSRIRSGSPEVDICLPVPAASFRPLRSILLPPRVAHLQNVLGAQTARAARARHPATGEPCARAPLCEHRTVIHV